MKEIIVILCQMHAQHEQENLLLFNPQAEIWAARQQFLFSRRQTKSLKLFENAHNLRQKYKLRQAFEIKQSFPSIQLISAQIQVQINERRRLDRFVYLLLNCSFDPPRWLYFFTVAP